ncbi:ER membrane protein complex subunit 8-like [Dendronephthya gigantea]|uniref:ER membrane protein complex subunit 8-like n=1 Tax=Dendronephthya gigantea TaxID=151771 RepID=UPI00106D94B2|nr:ER membrane protein complex subunit 8-like [Dendronephthya gigantea]
MKVVVSSRAYSKILLHASKYPHRAICGVLIAHENCDINKIDVLDAVPLFHLSLGLAPMMEVALIQVDAYCKSNKLQVVGYYQANQSLDNNSPDVYAYKIAEKLQENFSSAFILMVDNKKMGFECEVQACKLYHLQENKWKYNEKDLCLADDETLNIVSQLMIGKAYPSLVDFDNHLDDLSLDWLNPEINKVVDNATVQIQE